MEISARNREIKRRNLIRVSREKKAVSSGRKIDSRKRRKQKEHTGHRLITNLFQQKTTEKRDQSFKGAGNKRGVKGKNYHSLAKRKYAVTKGPSQPEQGALFEEDGRKQLAGERRKGEKRMKKSEGIKKCEGNRGQ